MHHIDCVHEERGSKVGCMCSCSFPCSLPFPTSFPSPCEGSSAPLHPGVPGSSACTQMEERSSVPPSQRTAGLSHRWAAWLWSRKAMHVVPLLFGLTLIAFCLAPAAELQAGEAVAGLLPTACPPVGHHLPRSPQSGFTCQHPQEAGSFGNSHSYHK